MVRARTLLSSRFDPLTKLTLKTRLKPNRREAWYRSGCHDHVGRHPERTNRSNAKTEGITNDGISSAYTPAPARPSVTARIAPLKTPMASIIRSRCQSSDRSSIRARSSEGRSIRNVNDIRCRSGATGA